MFDEIMIRTEDDLVSALRERASTVAGLRPKASTRSVGAAAEQALGFSLPPLLRRIYREVANGGFGPDYGLVGVAGGHFDDQRHNIVDLYVGTRSSQWMRHFEPNPGEVGLGIPNCLIPHSFDLGGLFSTWLDGVDILDDVFPGYNEP